MPLLVVLLEKQDRVRILEPRDKPGLGDLTGDCKLFDGGLVPGGG